MKRNILGLLLIGFILSSCSDAKKEEEGTLTDKKAELQKLKEEQRKINEQVTVLEQEIAKADPAALSGSARLVVARPLATQDFSHYIELQGKVTAEDISYVSPPANPGVVKALYVSEGQYVRKGQVLAKLDDQLIRQQLEPLKVQLATAKDTYERTKNLWDQGIGTYQQVLTAKTTMESLEKQIGIIQKQVALTTVKAPASGTAEEVNVRVGEMFTGYIGNTAQIVIVNTSDLRVVANVPENYIGRVKQGSSLIVTLPESNNREITARVSLVGKVINPDTRSFTVEAKLPSGTNLKPNQIARIKILDYSSKDAIVVPLNVVQSDENGKYVYVMVKDGDRMVARKKTVIIGEAYGDGIEIKSGLSAGEMLITEGYQNLYEGQVITTEVK